jgi:hypothetical protein
MALTAELRRATIAEHYREAFDRATGETVTLGTGFLPEDEDDTVDPPTLTPSGSSFATSNDVVSLSSSRDHWATPHYSLDFNHEDIPAFKRGIAR